MIVPAPTPKRGSVGTPIILQGYAATLDRLHQGRI